MIQRLRINVADDQTIASLKSLNTSSATWFGFPALEVNAGKDIVLGYQATSPGIFPQSRYSVQLHGDSAFRSSRVMKNGFATVGDSWHHYMGMSLDSFDDTGIWIVNGYADKSKNWGYAIGKVLGKAVPDLDVLQAYVQKGTKSPYELRLLVDNLGDGAAPPTRTALTLTRRGSPDIPLKTFHTPAIPAGRRTKTFVVRLRLPAGTVGAGYTLRVDLDADKQVREYDEGNNTLFVLAP